MRVTRGGAADRGRGLGAAAPTPSARFVARVPAPLCIGTLELEDGTRVSGFLCEAHALVGASDISRFGGWRPFLSSLN